MDVFKQCYEKRKNWLTEMVKAFTEETGCVPNLTVIRHRNNSQESESYVKSKKKIATEVGINIKEVFVDSICDARYELLGISNPFIIQMPFGEHSVRDVKNVIDTTLDYSGVNPIYDADGLSSNQNSRLLNARDCNQPATAKGIMWYLEYIYGNKLPGKSITIVNRSELIGKPLIQLCLQKDMGINIRHSKCHVEMFDSDIVVTATGNRIMYDEYFIATDYLGDPMVETIIDCSMAKFKGVDGVGDWDKESVQDEFPEINIASGYGYTGPMTCLALMDNVLNNYIRSKDRFKFE